MQYEIRRKGLEVLKEIDRNRDNCFIIHYSCQDFNDIPIGYSPRIISISINNLNTGQIKTFSMHLIAEIEGVEFNEIEKNYDKLEKKLLEKYFKFLNTHQTCKWIHWNMRDSNYGFSAIEHRYEVLGGKPIYLNDSNKIDLARIFNQIYGDKYIEDSKLASLIKKNELSDSTFLTGAEEAQAFKAKDFIAIYRSNLKKVNVIAHLYDLALNKKLKTNSSWIDQYGITAQGMYEYCTTNVWIILGWNILVYILGFVSKIFVFK